MDPTKFLLAEKEIPSAWYNIQADLPERLKPSRDLESEDRRAPRTLRSRAAGHVGLPPRCRCEARRRCSVGGRRLNSLRRRKFS
jgi:hypothetical protein